MRHDLKNRVRKALLEAPIRYDGPERMDPSLENLFNQEKTPYSKHPSLPDKNNDGVPDSFEQIIASKRFKDVIENLKRLTGVTNLSGMNGMMQLQNLVMGAMQRVLEIQSGNKEYLENLALDLVKKETGITDQINFEVNLVNLDQISKEGMMSKSKDYEQDEIQKQFGDKEEDEEDFQEDFMSFIASMENFNAETAKRRMLNALIQGGSKKGHYMYQLVVPELNRLDPDLVKLYGILMSFADYLPWVLPNEMVLNLASAGEGVSGREEIDDTTDPPTVKVQGVWFPVLINELLKGINEIVMTHGLPDDPRSAEMVMGVTDTLPNEVWDMRVGPIIYEKLVNSYPEQLFDEDKKIIQLYLKSRIASLSAEEFFMTMKEILAETPKGKQIVDKMVKEIIQELENEEYEDSVDSTDDDDEDLDDFLSNLGISLN
jgi:hypothetical protein